MEKKEFWKSKGFWGIVVTVASLVVPEKAPLIGDTIDAGLQIATEAGKIIGPLLTLWGRWTAKGPLTATPQPKAPDA